MNGLAVKISSYDDDKLVEVLEQVNRLHKNGYTDESPLREILDEAGANGLVTLHILIYKEATKRWLRDKRGE